ncbi:hypothetical protein SAMN02745161_1133 [Halodesulfovibrio marinisediminis DSM 17456]|uniref:Uncharacterized protein n=1 Tax=Halodesulfovibrio marinisediminis DSM 17456 TaxID=1121457 RepID=A0A1N6F6K8_9BACT|nr:hypothetical protein SAMN02745161_1133 [Halodesulfovibrio marinisediminis DSM 17456]
MHLLLIHSLHPRQLITGEIFTSDVLDSCYNTAKMKKTTGTVRYLASEIL